MLTLFMLNIFSGMASAEEPGVEGVAVGIKSSDAPPPARVLRRMESSVATVGDQLLVGRRISDVADNKASYEKLIREVFDRVLVGYSVQQVLLTPGTKTQIAVLISPWGEVVRDVRLEVDFDGVAPGAVTLIKKDMGNIGEKINDVLLGMPVDAVDWAGGVSRTLIREILAAQLPEFRANLDITAGQTTVIKLSLLPAGSVIHDVKVTLRSHSIPNMLLLEAKAPLEDAAAVLRGLPVAYVERHGDYFTNLFIAAVASDSMVRNYGLKLSSQLNTGTETEVVVNAETYKFKVTLEGYLDVGRSGSNTSAQLHVGEFVSKRDELFFETTFIPASVSWELEPGWGHRMGDSTEAGFRYHINDKNNILWLNQEIGKHWALRLERTPVTDHNELRVRYKLHDFLSVEYVFTNNERWLRLVGNL
ncbi:MAG: hypothetical protein P4N59_10270 [Negativicutes bacterium]|nr:hypothetical protein [Negativicutes bacterium]